MEKIKHFHNQEEKIQNAYLLYKRNFIKWFPKRKTEVKNKLFITLVHVSSAITKVQDLYSLEMRKNQ